MNFIELLICTLAGFFLVFKLLDNASFTLSQWIFISLFLSVALAWTMTGFARNQLKEAGLENASSSAVQEAQTVSVKSHIKLDYLKVLLEQMRISKYYNLKLENNSLFLTPKFKWVFRQFAAVQIVLDHGANGNNTYIIKPGAQAARKLTRWPRNISLVNYLREVVLSADRAS